MTIVAVQLAEPVNAAGGVLIAGPTGPQGPEGQPGRQGDPGKSIQGNPGNPGPAAIAPIQPWQAGVQYLVNPPASYVAKDGGSYICAASHIAGVFADDLAAGYWTPAATPGRSAGLRFRWSAATSGDPGAGKLAVNNATFASITSLAVSETDADGNNLAALIATWDDSTSPVRGTLRIENPGAPTNFMAFQVTGAIADSGAYDAIPVTSVAQNGAFAAGDILAVTFTRAGDRGADGNGAGNVNPDAGTFTPGHLAVFRTADGRTIGDGGPPRTIGQIVGLAYGDGISSAF